jgi:hypothetical protein
LGDLFAKNSYPQINDPQINTMARPDWDWIDSRVRTGVPNPITTLVEFYRYFFIDAQNTFVHQEYQII